MRFTTMFSPQIVIFLVKLQWPEKEEHLRNQLHFKRFANFLIYLRKKRVFSTTTVENLELSAQTDSW